MDRAQNFGHCSEEKGCETATGWDNKIHEMKRLGVLVKDGTKAVLAGVTRERPGGPTTPTAAKALPGTKNASFWIESETYFASWIFRKSIIGK